MHIERFVRNLGIAIVVIIFLVVVAAFAIPRLVNLNQYHDRIQAELQQRLGRTVTFGDMHLSIIPLAFRVDNATIAEDPSLHSDRPFAQVEELDVSAKLLPLLHKDVQIDSLELLKPKIELVRSAQGAWNFSTLGKHGANATEQKPGSAPALSLADLKIRDGQVAITDYQKHQSRAVYDHIDLVLKDFAPDKPFSVDATVHLPGAGSQEVSLKGKGGPIDQQDPINTPFNGTVKLTQVSLASAQQFLNTQSLKDVDGVASGDVDINNQRGKLDSKGSLKLDQARIRGVNIGYPITVDYDINDDLTNDVLRIQKGALKLGSTPLSISGTINMKPTPAQLDVKLNASDVSLEEAARLAGAVGVAFNPNMQVKGKMTADVHASGAATQPAMNGTLSAQDIAITGKDVPQPVQVKGIQLALAPDAIRSNNFSASTGGTTVNAQFTLTQYTTQNPGIDMTMKTANANVGELLNIAKAYGVSAADGMSGSGSISLDLHATGPIKNSSAMNFAGSGAIQNASVKTPQLTQPVNVRNANLQFTQNSVVLQNLAAAIGHTNATGGVTMHNFSAPQVQFTLNADTVNVAELEQLFSSGPPQQQQQQKRSALNIVPSAEAATAPSPSLVTKMTGNGTVSIGTVIDDQLQLNNVHSNVTLDRGIIRMQPLTAQLYGGQENGAITVDMRPTPITYVVQSKFSNVDANKLISSVSSLKATIYGLLASNGNLSFSGTNTDQIARTLNGKLSLDLRNGKIVGMDILNELSQVGKFVGFNHAASNFTNVAQLTGDFDVQNGVARTNNLKAVIDGGTLAATGAVGLADQSLNLNLTAVLSKGMSDAVGGTGIGGLMNTALANNRGELVIPVQVTGTFSHPRFAPDMQKIAQMRMQNLLPTSGNPGQLTNGILGALMGGGQRGGAAGQNQQQGGLGGILGAIQGAQQQGQRQPAQNQQNRVAQPQSQQRQKPANPIGDAVNSILGGQQQQQDQQQQQQNPQR